MRKLLAMSEVQQDMSSDEERARGPFVTEFLFSAPPPMPSVEQVEEVLVRKVGSLAQVTQFEEQPGFFTAAQDHPIGFDDGESYPLLMVAGPTESAWDSLEDIVTSQMWDVGEERDRILSEGVLTLGAIETMGGMLPAQTRAELLMNFIDGVAELFPDFIAVFFPESGRLLTAEQFRTHMAAPKSRYIHVVPNVRLFNVPETEAAIVDTIGMAPLNIPDMQYHFHSLDPNDIVLHARWVLAHQLEHNVAISSGDTMTGIRGAVMDQELVWGCHYEQALLQPPREVLDIVVGEYAANHREPETSAPIDGSGAGADQQAAPQSDASHSDASHPDAPHPG